MGLNVFLCASAYPEKEQTVSRVGIDVTDCIDGFVKAIGRNEILPFLGIYQRLAYSYFFFKKLLKEKKVDFVLVTGGSTIIPQKMVKRTIVYVYYPSEIDILSDRYLDSARKKAYVMPWAFITKNLDHIKEATIITLSNYSKNAIKDAWGIDAAIIYPPCPQYSFPIAERKQDVVCTLSRFTPDKGYDRMLKVAERLPNVQFEFVGSVAPDKIGYLEMLQSSAPKNVTFHVNASVAEKIGILKRSKVMLHSFIGEHFGIGLVEAMSAGVTPVTHNSGAAKIDNLVPEQYRYDDMEQMVACVSNALSSWNVEEAHEMREFARKFSSEAFRENLKIFLRHWMHINNI